LIKEKVEKGDVIYIEEKSGDVKRKGRSDKFEKELDIEEEEYVKIKKGDVKKKKEVIKDVKLNELDVDNDRNKGGKDIM
jgi:RuvB-like protein 1 (pontin 52)